MRILVLNGGSSSLKCALYDFAQDVPALAAPPLFKENLELGGTELTAVLAPVLKRAGAGAVDAVGHRIVHGGACRTTTRITADTRAAIAAQSEVAPVHNRLELATIDAVEAVLGTQVPQVAVFDTSFHTTLAPAAFTFPGPYEWFHTEGIRRYGFHGISYQYATRRAADMLEGTPKRLLICHLGSGASLCAVLEGRSVDTTMGFTPLDGLMMATRCGSIDPGILIYLLRHRHYTAERLDQILNRESGLLGISGTSGDMRAILHAISEGDARAQLAFDIYVHSLVREAGSMIAVLGGLDALVFTGGVGENSSAVREALCKALAFLGLEIEPSIAIEPESDQDIAAPASKVPVLVIHAQEEWEIARECRNLLAPTLKRDI